MKILLSVGALDVMIRNVRRMQQEVIRTSINYLPKSVFHGASTLVDEGRLITETLQSHSDTAHLVGLFWISDQSDSETSV